MSEVCCHKADLHNERDAKETLFLLNTYSMDAMGAGEPLSQYTQEHLISELIARPYAHVFIARINDVPVGLITSFEGFSSFQAKPLLNLHDVVIIPGFRGKGIAQNLLSEAEKYARSIGCCKLTLEVLQNNLIAKKAYTKFGFAGYQLSEENGHAEFWQKEL